MPQSHTIARSSTAAGPNRPRSTDTNEGEGVINIGTTPDELNLSQTVFEPRMQALHCTNPKCNAA
jgi:hypothetical protein